MKRIVIVFVAGMLVGGMMVHLFRAGGTADHDGSTGGIPAGANAESASTTIGNADGMPTSTVDDSTAMDSADRGVLAALDAALAIEDPGDRERAVRGAIDRFDALPTLDRAQLARRFATRFAAVDPDAAIEWAQSARLPGLVDEVLAVLANADPLRAIELAADGVGSSVGLAVQAALESASTPMRELADVVALVSPGDLTLLASSWMQRDPDAAVEWILEQPANVASSLLGNTFYLRDQPALFERYLDRVPLQVRPQWVRDAARAYALTAPEAALVWIERFRGSREFESAQTEVVTAIAGYDGAMAAALIDSRALWSHRPMVNRVIEAWFHYDPDAASAWAAGIPERFARQAALIVVGNSQVRLDPGSANGFIARLPADSVRDGVLDGMLSSASSLTSPNRDNWTLIESLLDAYVSNEAREQQVAQFSVRIARDYEAEARELMERYVTDPELWDRFEAVLAP